MDYSFGLEIGFSEFDYLHSGGRGRYYREVIRYMYIELQKKEYLFSHEILTGLKNSNDFFSDYTEEQCNKDLEYLFEKGNVIKYKNDYGQIKSLDELKKKRYRYQLTERCRLIENLIINNFNKINTLTNTLDPNLLVRLREELGRIQVEYDNLDAKKLYSRWVSIMNAFKLLRENYQGYIAELNNFEYEKLIESEEFLRRKGRLKEYLEDFINALIKESSNVARILLNLENSEKLEELLIKVSQVQYERIQLTAQGDFKEEQLKIETHYEAMRRWFISDNNNESEAESLRKSTLNIINKITRLARIFIDKEKISYSRKESYKYIAKLVLERNKLEDANLISSIVFGNFEWVHIKGNYSIPEEEVLKVEDAKKLEFQLSAKKTRKNTSSSYKVKNKNALKTNALYELEKDRKNEKDLLFKFMENLNGKSYIFLESLPVINRKIKNLFIDLIKKGLSKVKQEESIVVIKDKLYYEYNFTRFNAFDFKIYRPQNENDRIILESFDGDLNLPAFIIEFIHGDENEEL